MNPFFDEAPDRKGTNSLKWAYQSTFPDAPGDALPMWIADMEFSCAPAIIQALHQRVDQGIFGYSTPDAAYYNSIIGWFFRRYQWQIRPEELCHAPGVVPAISILIQCLSAPGDGIIIQPPVYNPFHETITANGRTVYENPLLADHGRYTIDFEGLEGLLASPDTKGLLLCNPHNPVGRVWSRQELLRLAQLCQRHGKWIISDDIHCDICRAGVTYTPIASVAREYGAHIFTCTSPGKSFNLPGLQSANIVISNSQVKEQYLKVLEGQLHIGLRSPFAISATIAAYDQSEAWLAALNEYLDENIKAATVRLSELAPELSVTPSQGTYLMWLDCTGAKLDGATLMQRLGAMGKVIVNHGAIYGGQTDGFIRVNAACPRHMLLDGVSRIAQAIHS